MPNSGYLDKSVHWKVRTGALGFAEPTHAETAQAIVESGLAWSVGQRLGSGKEADVYFAEGPEGRLAVKVYRQYRTSHKGGGPLKLESMGQRAVREFELLAYAFQGGASVPRPYRRVENQFSMQYLGTAEAAAPELTRAVLEDPERFLRRTEDGIVALAEAGLVHSDLSPFNVLVWHDAPWFIDLAEGVRVDRLGWPPWERLTTALQSLRRGLAAMARYFRRYGLTLDEAAVLGRVREQIDRYRIFEE